MACFAVGIVADILGIVGEARYLAVLDDLAAGVDVDADQVQAAEDRTLDASLVQLLAFLVIMIAFLFWFRRAYRNLPAFGAGMLRFRPGWAVWGWFVPILNLFRPKQIANDIWRASGPDEVEGVATGWLQRPVAAVVHVWWGAWLLTTWVGNFGGLRFLQAETLSEQQAVSRANIAAYLLSVATAVLAIVVVRAITARQEARIASLEANPATQDAPRA